MNNAYFVHQVQHNKDNDTWTKGIVIKADPSADNEAAALQTYHAYLGAYAYGQHAETDFVSCLISDEEGLVLMSETWKAAEPE